MLLFSALMYIVNAFKMMFMKKKLILIVILLLALTYRVSEEIKSTFRVQLTEKFQEAQLRYIAIELLNIYEKCHVIIPDLTTISKYQDCFHSNLMYPRLLTDRFNKLLFYNRVSEKQYFLAYAANSILYKDDTRFQVKPLGLIINFETRKIVVSEEVPSDKNYFRAQSQEIHKLPKQKEN